MTIANQIQLIIKKPRSYKLYKGDILTTRLSQGPITNVMSTVNYDSTTRVNLRNEIVPLIET